MLKKVLSLFIFISSLCILPVYADKEYKFTLNKPLENKEIIYTWENNIENFSFEMVSPSKEVYNEITYDLVKYDSENNTVSICFDDLEAGQWKVFFRGDSDPIGLKNSIIDYYSTSTEEDFTEDSSEDLSIEKDDEKKSDIIIIGAQNEETKEIVEETDIKEVENTELETDSEIVENNEDEEIVLTEEELKLLEEKEELAKKRLEERNFAKEEKKAEKELELKKIEEQEFEEQREENSVELVFEESPEIEEEKSTEEQVIILGNDANTSPEVVTVQKSDEDVNLVNIDADEERAKIQQKIEQENTKSTINNIIMVMPLITVIILFLLNLVLKKKMKKTRK